jgi:hypothetical protein
MTDRWTDVTRYDPHRPQGEQAADTWQLEHCGFTIRLTRIPKREGWFSYVCNTISDLEALGDIPVEDAKAKALVLFSEFLWQRKDRAAIALEQLPSNCRWTTG